MLLQSGLAAVRPTIMDIFDAPVDALRHPSRQIAGKFAQHAITYYRTNLSAKKGYRCACGVMGCMTCSTVGLKLYKKFGPVRATRLLVGQFAKCRKMAGIFNMAAKMPVDDAAAAVTQKYGMMAHRARSLVMVAQSQMACDTSEEQKKKSPARRRTEFCVAAEGAYCLPDACDVGSMMACDAGLSSCELPACEMSACEVGSCDVGACDLSL